MSVNSTSPAILFGGTWDAMPAGRVLLAQGESEWGVEYKAGSTGGEHEHQLSVGELPSHTHQVTLNTDGNHSHGIRSSIMDSSDSMTLPNKGVGKNDGWWDKYCATAGYHSHSASISSTGSNQPYSIMQPYITVFMWHRTTQRPPVGELPAHGHNATANSTGDHTHTVVGRDGGATKYTDNASYYKRTDTSSTYNTGSSGSHTHSVTVDKSGEGKSHNTMQPYLSCYMWRRTL